MFYFKKPLLRNQKRFKINFTDFSGGLNTALDKNILSQKYAVNTYNVKSSTGALTTGMGIEKLKLKNDTNDFEFLNVPQNVKKLIYFKKFDRDEMENDDRLLAITNEGDLYSANISKFTQFEKIVGVSFNKTPNFVCYRLNGDDVVIMTSEEDDMIIWDGVNAPYPVYDAPKITSMCVHYERLFVTAGKDKSAVWFSDDLDPSNWSVSLEEAGFIEMADDKGGLLKVIKFIDYVYIFRSYGIARLTAYADQTQFTLNQLFTTSGRIYPDTVTICGDIIIFLAEDGMYVFDGLSTQKIFKSIQGFFKGADFSKSKGAFVDGCYYLSLIKPLDENYLIRYNVSENNIDILKGPEIIDILPITAEDYTKLAVLIKDDNNIYTLCDSGCFLGVPLHKIWITPVTDLNYPEYFKIVKKIMINTKYDITLTLISDIETKSFKVCGKENKIAEINTQLKGRLFSMKIESDEPDIYVAKPSVLVDI